MPYDENKQQELRKTMPDHDYHIGDLVSYCGRPAMVTFVSDLDTLADIVYLDKYMAISVGIQDLHFLAAGQHYLREAQAFCRTLCSLRN